MGRPAHVRRFLIGRPRILESYEAWWHSPGFPPEKLRVRVDRYGDRAEISGCMLDVDDQLRPGPAHTRILAALDWERFAALVEEGFWRAPPTTTCQRLMDGESWSITGFRRQEYREISRQTKDVVSGTGTATFALGAWMARAAGLRRCGCDDGAEPEARPSRDGSAATDKKARAGGEK